MSSFATATSRTGDKDPQNGKQQLHLLPNPDETAAASAAPQPEPGVAGITTQTLDEVNRVERLISQLEARSMALVPYGYGSLREVGTRKSNTALLAGTLIALWIATLVLGMAYLRYVSHSAPGVEHPTVAPLIIPSDQEPQTQKVAASVDDFAKALASSSERMKELQAAMEKSNRDLQRIANSTPVKGPAKTNVPPASRTEEVDTAALPAVPETNLPRNWHRVLDLKPTAAAVAHKGTDGSIDYWLVPRGADPSPSKVLPIGTSTEGVVVHNLEDGKDYTVTPTGEWRNGALTPGSN